MVEVVITLSESCKSSDDVVPGRVSVFEWLVSEPVSKRIYTEGSVVDEHQTEYSGVEVSASPVTPTKSSNEHREEESHSDGNLAVVAVLPHDDWVCVQVGNVGSANLLWVLLQNHPTEVRVPESLSDRVWILFGVGISMMSSVISRPPSDGALDGTASKGSQDESQDRGGRVRTVSPIPMISSCYTQTGTEVVDEGPYGSFVIEGGGESPVYSNHRYDEDDWDVEPV